MDGSKKRLNESIQLKLSLTISLVIVAVAIAAGFFSFMSAVDEAHELQDDLLRQIAQMMDHQHLPPATGAPLKYRNEDSRIIVQRLDDARPFSLSIDAGGVLPLSATLADGMHTLRMQGDSFRVLIRTTAAGERIAVSQESDFRDEIARASAWRTVTPFVVLVPVLLLIVAHLVRNMFRPVAAISREVDLLSGQDLRPVDDGNLPREIRPFVMAINRLLARVANAMNAQRRFVADAAHELRSPLTALSLQAERLSEAEMSEAAHERLRALRRGIERGRNLLDQLLALARAQAPTDLPKSLLSVQDIYRRVLEDLVILAEAKGIDIGVEGTQDATVLASELDMLTLCKNLIDNAIRYTPPGGRVDLSVGAVPGFAALNIRDTGPGVAPSERGRIFDPFYRTLGSEQLGAGLGLSIVQAIAQRLGAEIRLSFSDEAAETGLTVVVLVPLAPVRG